MIKLTTPIQTLEKQVKTLHSLLGATIVAKVSFLLSNHLRNVFCYNCGEAGTMGRTVVWRPLTINSSIAPMGLVFPLTGYHLDKCDVA